MKILSASQKIPVQWKRCLSNSANKEDLLSFLVSEWSTQTFVAVKLFDKYFFVNQEEKCYLLSSDESRQVVHAEVAALRCSHEEADSRLIVHTSHVSTTGHETVVLRSPDTDVTVLGVAHSQDVEARIIFLTGTKQRRRYIDLTAIGRQLCHHVCQGLLALHYLTGCD